MRASMLIPLVAACARAALLVWAFGALSGVPLHAQATPPAARLQPYRDSVPGTLVGFEMVPVPGGEVTVADSAGLRSVKIGPVFVSRTEVTWELYDVFVLGRESRLPGGATVARPSEPYGAPDYGWGHAGFPVISVTYAAARAFCDWLSAVTGQRYRLPTEAEWQHLAALATRGAGLPADSLDALAWHRGNSEHQTHRVGSRRPDALGLFDLFGNAAEWVTTAAGTGVLRGGSFRDPLDDVGPGARAVQDPTWNARDPQTPKSVWWLSDAPFAGFRIVRDP